MSHFRHSTTRFGIVQHSLGKEHDLRHGYSIDDSARALIVCVWYAHLYGPELVRDIAPIYLNYLRDAQLSNGRFHNFRNAEGQFIDNQGGDDSFGRTIWALGCVLSHPDYFGLHALARQIYDKAVSIVRPKQLSLRSLAYLSLGLWSPADRDLHTEVVNELVARYTANAEADWPWFEGNLRYANGILPYALLASPVSDGRGPGRNSLDFLNQASRIDGVPVPIGNQGWHVRNGHRAMYDQQCLEALDMILANAAAYLRQGDVAYQKEISDWFAWFYGLNTNDCRLVTDDGGCYDGLGKTDYNTNQGAESTLAYLMSHLAYTSVGREDGTFLVG